MSAVDSFRLWRGKRATGAEIQAEDRSLRREQGIWLLAAAALTLAPHATHLPLWISLLGAALLGWRALLLWRGHRPPPRLLVLAIAIGAAVGIKLHFGQFFGKDPGVALLAILLGLKLLEVRAVRDIRAAVLLAFFLQLGIFFYSQSLAVAASVAVSLLFALVALLSLHDDKAATGERLRTAGLLMAQGLPFMIALFILFPRIQGPLWGLPADAYSGYSGLSDIMEPGSISSLTLSDEIAFRAQFHDAPPPSAQRYWRGPVLDKFDGRAWLPTPGTRLTRDPAYGPRGPRYDYALTLEPHNQRWILALDFPGPTPERVRFTEDYQVIAAGPLRQRARFELTAFPETQVGLEETDEAIARALQLPAGFNPRARALAEAMAAGTPQERLARAVEYLRASELVYTLTPPLLGEHSVDEFLFSSRRGFCEHFASAFVFLMRAAGVPARVVTGYQGGEINPVDGTLVVRQADAHAWAEVWLEGRGWVRVDPTALAAPERVEAGLAAALPAGEQLPLMLRSDLTLLRALRHRWEALSNTWNQWVLGYNPTRQQELLARLGLHSPDWRTMIATLASIGAALMGALFAWALMQRYRRDPLDRAWDAFCRKFARRGLARPPWEGPIAYARRLAAARPRDAEVVRDIAQTYALLRYRPGADPAAVRSLVQRIRRFRPS